MNVRINDICEAIEQWAPRGLAYEWDKPGLSIGEPGAAVRKILVCLTVTREVYQTARKAQANLVVSHHPFIFEPLKNLRSDDPHTRLCLDFVHAGIACYAAHTNLDVVPDGVSGVLANALELLNPKPLFTVNHAAMLKLVTFVPESHLAYVRDAVSEAGAGIIGEYTHCSFSTPGVGTFKPSSKANPFSGQKGAVNEEPERRFETLVPKARLAQVLKALISAHPYEEVAYDLAPLENRDTTVSLGIKGTLKAPMRLSAFAHMVKTALRLNHVRMAGTPKRQVRTVAVLGGAGGSEVSRIPGDVDVYVTGDVKYHEAQAALLRGLAIIDAGHAGTEKGIVPVMASFLRSRFRGLPVAAYNEAECFTVID
ncbi:MAG TPA: Nif3-like dinuclear metal center hexameric protein [Candidatus Hydrogenedentes bacterium]|nr:Nif3-like dinuclear metal center hexameric protein [Candidatus Hydrogenedentota bacterium]